MALSDADRQWLLENLAKRIDLGFARDQLMTHLGKLATAAPLPASALPGVEVARRVDVEALSDAFEAGLAEITTLLRALLEHLDIEIPDDEDPDEEDPEDPDEEDPEDPDEEDPDEEDPEDPAPTAWRPDPQLWKVTLPIGNNGDPVELYPFALRSPYVVGREDGVLFNAPCVAISTENSSYPRSELREMTRGGGRAAWSNTDGEHHLAVDLTITKTPVVKPHVVAGQIHDEDDDVVMIRLEGKRLFVESDGDEIALLDANYTLGTRFKYAIWAGNGRIHVSYNGAQKLDIARQIRGGYFKAGAYTQSNPSKGDAPTAAGEVIIHDLVLTHR